MGKQNDEGTKQNKRRTASRRNVTRAHTPSQLEEWVEEAIQADPDFDVVGMLNCPPNARTE